MRNPSAAVVRQAETDCGQAAASHRSGPSHRAEQIVAVVVDRSWFAGVAIPPQVRHNYAVLRGQDLLLQLLPPLAQVALKRPRLLAALPNSHERRGNDAPGPEQIVVARLRQGDSQELCFLALLQPQDRSELSIKSELPSLRRTVLSGAALDRRYPTHFVSASGSNTFRCVWSGSVPRVADD